MSTSTKMLSRRLALPNGVNGQTIPQIHLGLYEMSPSETTKAVTAALAAGYRGFDSAQWYENESPASSAILTHLASNPSLPRSSLFYTTKLRHNSTSPSTVRASIASSISSSPSYIDLLLLHSPLGGRAARLASWRAIEDAILSGQVRSGGVSNFGVRHIEELMGSELRVKPVVNQIEVHPFNTQREIREVCEKYGIQVQAYAPLARGMRFGHPVLKEVAGRYGCSEAQLMVRWSIQHGFVTLPKSTRQERIVSNADVGWFEISKEDMETLDGLDEKLVTDWDPTDAP